MKNRRYQKICFVKPSLLMTWETNKYVWPPLGPLYLAAAIRNVGYEPSIVDSVLEGFDEIIPVNDEVYLLGLKPEELADKVLAQEPDVVGISWEFANQDWCVRKLAKIIRQRAPEVHITTGGPTATLRAERVFEIPEIDSAMWGDTDFRMPEFLDWLNSGSSDFGIMGSAVRMPDGEIKSNPLTHGKFPFDDAPRPARDLIDMDRYYEKIHQFKMHPKSWPATSMITSRGCPGNCVFCANPRLHGRYFVPRSPEMVVEEMIELVDKYGAKELVIFDENWSANPKRAERMLDLMIEADLGVSWYPQDSAVWTMNDTILEKMAKSGCYRVKFSIESGNQRVLKEVIDKPVQLDMAKPVIARAQELGMAVGANFVIGFPDETREELLDSLEYAVDLDADFTVFNIATPFNHTRLTDQAIKNGLLPKDFNFDSLEPGITFWDIPGVSQEELRKWRYDYWMKCNFRTPEKEERYHRYSIKNPNFEPIVKPEVIEEFDLSI